MTHFGAATLLLSEQIHANRKPIQTIKLDNLWSTYRACNYTQSERAITISAWFSSYRSTREPCGRTHPKEDKETGAGFADRPRSPRPRSRKEAPEMEHFNGSDYPTVYHGMVSWRGETGGGGGGLSWQSDSALGREEVRALAGGLPRVFALVREAEERVRRSSRGWWRTGWPCRAATRPPSARPGDSAGG